MLIFSKLPQQFSVKIESLDRTVTLQLELGRPGKPWRSGIRNLSDLRWYQYRILGGKEWLKHSFDRVLVMPYVIDDLVFNEAKEVVINGGVAAYDAPRPHVDFGTGNIHPAKLSVKEMPDEEIKQLILTSGNFNPKTNQYDSHCFPKLDEKPDAPYYEYCANCSYLQTKAPLSPKKIYVPKACYYPLIDKEDEKELEDSYAYQLLKAVWEKLVSLEELENYS